MQGLVIVSLAVIGLSVVDALPSPTYQYPNTALLQTRSAKDREPKCDGDRSAFLYFGRPPNRIKYKDVACNCSYMTDSSDYQEGSSLRLDWFKNRACGNMSFLDVAIGSMKRRAWELRCQCKEYTLKSQNECLFSAIPGRWVKCTVYPNPAAPESDDTFCSEMEFQNGTVIKATAWCSYPDLYDWGR